MSFEFLSNLSRVIQQVSKDKGVSQQAVIDSVVQGVLSAVRRKYGSYRDIEVKYNEDLGELELFEFKKVVPDKEFEDELIEIKYSAAKELDPEAQLGDQIGSRLEMKDLGRIDAQSAKQIIIQNLQSIEHKIIFNEFEKRKGEIASGVVRRVDPGMIVVDLEKTEAYIPRKEQIPGEQYKSGDRIQGYLLEVRQTTKGPQIIMSRAHEQYLIKLFEREVPEVSEGIVKIVSAAREPGQRAKMSVYSADPAVHPVGSCVGIKGSRVQNITQELKGERVDVIVWEDDSVQYICNALAPAKISKILMDEDQKQMQIIVPDDQLSLAIGKKGQNVRLASKLTGWSLNLVSEQESKQAKKTALFNLSLLPEISETKAQSLFQYGYSELSQLAEADPNELKSIPEFENEKEAVQLIQAAQALIKKYADEGKELPKLEDVKEDKKPLASSLKEQAEEILKRELAQLEGGKSPAQPKTEGKPAEETTKKPAKISSPSKVSSPKEKEKSTLTKSEKPVPSQAKAESEKKPTNNKTTDKNKSPIDKTAKTESKEKPANSKTTDKSESPTDKTAKAESTKKPASDKTTDKNKSPTNKTAKAESEKKPANNKTTDKNKSQTSKTAKTESKEKPANNKANGKRESQAGKPLKTESKEKPANNKTTSQNKNQTGKTAKTESEKKPASDKATDKNKSPTDKTAKAESEKKPANNTINSKGSNRKDQTAKKARASLEKAPQTTQNHPANKPKKKAEKTHPTNKE